MQLLFFISILWAFSSAFATLSPIFCEFSSYKHDESLNKLGPNKCINNCDCDGLRFCNSIGYCSGVPRPPEIARRGGSRSRSRSRSRRSRTKSGKNGIVIIIVVFANLGFVALIIGIVFICNYFRDKKRRETILHRKNIRKIKEGSRKSLITKPKLEEAKKEEKDFNQTVNVRVNPKNNDN